MQRLRRIGHHRSQDVTKSKIARVGNEVVFNVSPFGAYRRQDGSCNTALSLVLQLLMIHDSSV